MIVEVPTAGSTTTGPGVQTLYQRVALAPADITELETRKLDRTRTAAIVGVVAVAAVSLAVKYLHEDPGIDRPPTGSPPENRLPLVRIRF